MSTQMKNATQTSQHNGEDNISTLEVWGCQQKWSQSQQKWIEWKRKKHQICKRKMKKQTTLNTTTSSGKQ